MNHQHIVTIAAKWLKKHHRSIEIPNCSQIASEIVSATITGEIPDVIGWCSWTSILLEIKSSRADFKKDAKKVFRALPDLGMGEFRYYVCPTNLIYPEDIPSNWGLLYCNEEGLIEIVKVAIRQESNLKCEITILLSLLRRNK